jgi:hypothetical protein
MIEIKITAPFSHDWRELKEIGKCLVNMGTIQEERDKTYNGDKPQDCSIETDVPIYDPRYEETKKEPETDEPKSDVYNVGGMQFPQHVPVVNLNQSGVELDSHGLPWDARIHARTKTKVADGSWKLMRGVASNVVEKIEAELRQTMSAPGTVRANVEAPAHFNPFAQTVPAVDTFVPPAPLPEMDFDYFINHVTKLVNTNKITQPKVIEIVQSFGISNIPMVAARPDLVPAIINHINGAL